MDLPDIHQRLRSFGLSPHQARVYVAALRWGPLTGSQLAEKARVPRTKVYEVCKELMDKGLVEPESVAPRRFRAMPLARALELRKSELHRQAESLERMHHELAAQLARLAPPPQPAVAGLESLQGEARVAAHLRLMARDARATIDMVLAEGGAPVLAQVLQERREGVAVRVVHKVEPTNLARALQFEGQGVRIRHARAAVFTTSLVVDRAQALILIHPESAEPPSLGLWSTVPSMVAGEEARFAVAWKEGTSLRRRSRELQQGGPARTTELLRHDGDEAAGFAVFASACIASLRDAGDRVDIALGAPFLASTGNDELWDLLSKRRVRLLLPSLLEPRSSAMAERASAFGEARRMPSWLGDQAMLVAGDTASLVASVDPATGEFDTVIASNEPGLVHWLGRVFNVAWEMSAEPRPDGQDRAALWTMTHRAAEAEVWLRNALSVATSLVEVQGPQGAEELIRGLLEDPGVKVRWRPLPEAAGDALVVGVDQRVLLVLEGAKFAGSRAARFLRAVDACVLTDSRAMRALHGRNGEEAAQR